MALRRLLLVFIGSAATDAQRSQFEGISSAMLAPHYGSDMIIYAGVYLDGTPQVEGTLAAYIGSEIRGIGSATSVPPDAPVALAGYSSFDMQVYSDASGPTVTFQFEDASMMVHELNETLAYVSDSVVGSPWEPVHFNLYSISTAAPPTTPSAAPGIFSPPMPPTPLGCGGGGCGGV